MKLVEDKKAALAQELKTGSAAQGRDLLTLLIKSNMAYENEGQRMTDDEVIGRMSKILQRHSEFISLSLQKYRPSSLQATRLRARLRHGHYMRLRNTRKLSASFAGSCWSRGLAMNLAWLT
jgi:hypothetical protein